MGEPTAYLGLASVLGNIGARDALLIGELKYGFLVKELLPEGSNKDLATALQGLRTLTEDENLLWRVNGTDMAASEGLVTQIAEERGLAGEDFVLVVSTQYDQCYSQMRLLKQTIWECLALKDERFEW